MTELAQQAFEAWITSFHGGVQEAYNRGVVPWEKMPIKAQQAWSAAVQYVLLQNAVVQRGSV